MEILSKSNLIKTNKAFTLKHKTDRNKDLNLIGYVVCVCKWGKELSYTQGGCDIDRYRRKEKAIYEMKDGTRAWEWVKDILFTNLKSEKDAHSRASLYLKNRLEQGDRHSTASWWKLKNRIR